MDYISTVKKDNKEYCLGGDYYNIVFNKGDTIGSILDQIPDLDVNEEKNYEVLWSGDVFGISFGDFYFFKDRNGSCDIAIYGASFQELNINISSPSLESLRNYIIGDEDLETALLGSMIQSDIPETELDGNRYDVVFRDGHIMFDFTGVNGR